MHFNKENKMLLWTKPNISAITINNGDGVTRHATNNQYVKEILHTVRRI